MKLCLIYNFAQHYRASIFQLIDQEFDCDFVFGDSYLDVKKMDYSLLKGGVKECHTKRFGSWYYMQGVVPLLKKDYDSFILLGETHSLSTWLFCIKARLFHPKKRVYFWSHGWYGKESWLEKVIKKVLFKLPNGGVFLYGNHARELMIKEGFDPDKLYVIHNSLAYDEQISIRKQLKPIPIYPNHFNNNNPNLFFIGRLTEVKRLDMVLYAMAILHEKGREYNMTFIGDGAEGKSLKELAMKLGLEKNVWFYGACYDEKAIGEMIYNADLCVAPGNIGLTAMHTLVFGTPAITHNDFPHQMPEFEAIQEGVTGTFFENENRESLADGIDCWFAKHKDDREAVRQACMKEIDESWTPQFQIDILKKVL